MQLNGMMIVDYEDVNPLLLHTLFLTRSYLSVQLLSVWAEDASCCNLRRTQILDALIHRQNFMIDEIN